ncbi:hypothetical protein CHS0354_029584, partial [Potamilus streckersoni]
RLVRSYQPRKKDEEDYQFSWAKGFLDMMKELHDLAGQHEVIAETTQATLIKDLLTLVQELKQDRRKYLLEGTKVQEQYRNSLTQLDKVKRLYERAFKEAEKSYDAYKKADADINLSRAEVERQKAISRGKQQLCDESKSEYASQLQETNKNQKDFFTVQMPSVFQQLQELDEKRINKIKEIIKESANVETNVIPIIKTCIDGMIKAADSINASEDSRLVVEKFKSGFQIPGDIPFEDLSNRVTDNQANNVSKPNPTPETRKLQSSGGTLSGKTKTRKGIFGIFGSSKIIGMLLDEQKEDFSDLPPNQRKKQLLKKIDAFKKDIARETAEREGMLKLKEVYANNNALGDPHSLDKKLEENAQKLEALQQECKKFQEYLADAEGKSRRHSTSDDSISQSTSDGSVQGNIISAPGTPIPPHNVYAPIAGEEDMPPEPDLDEFENQGTDDYPVIGTCRALYGFEATNQGSISMKENEEMYILEQDQGDGWTRVRKHDSSEGFVPTSYIQCHFYDQDAV